MCYYVCEGFIKSYMVLGSTWYSATSLHILIWPLLPTLYKSRCEFQLITHTDLLTLADQDKIFFLYHFMPSLDNILSQLPEGYP